MGKVELERTMPAEIARRSRRKARRRLRNLSLRKPMEVETVRRVHTRNFGHEEDVSEVCLKSRRWHGAA